MKIKDIPQVGKLGLTVTWPGRNGLIRRTLATPRNPRTAAQQVTRQSLATQPAAYDQLTDAQQEAWIAAAAQMQSKPTLGQSGPLTGLQLLTWKNRELWKSRMERELRRMQGGRWRVDLIAGRYGWCARAVRLRNRKNGRALPQGSGRAATAA
jgi:hypothetical protein